MRTFGAALAHARRGLAMRRRRTLLSGVGIAVAAAMLCAGVVLSDGLGLGFDRAVAASHLPDLIVRFGDQPRSSVVARVQALPDVAGYATREEVTGVSVAARGQAPRGDAVAEVLDGSSADADRRGYALVAGRPLHGAGREILVEKAFADAWGLHLGSTLQVGELGAERVVGLVEAPDNVGFPLAKPRFYLTRAQIDARFGADRNPDVDLVEIWLRNPRYLDQVLVQARATSFGLRNLQFATRAGVRVLLDQAAGIVIDLLVALSLIALLTAAVLLAASARAEVQRRLPSIGIRRAVGATRGQVALTQAIEAALVAVPAATVGTLAAVLIILGPTDRLLTLLNEPGPGAGLVAPLLAAWLVAVGLPTLGAAWPAFSAAGGSVIGLLRGGAALAAPRRSRGPRAAGLTMLGARLASARRVRLLATVAMLTLSSGFVLLLVALASALGTLETDPSALGKRYQLTAALPPDRVAVVRQIPGVSAAAPRYDVQAANSFALGEIVDVIAYPGDHTRFEAPPLVVGHRLRGAGEAEVGEGLANTAGLSPGATLALALPNGTELRLRVAGVVSSLDREGEVAYVPAAALLRIDPGAAADASIAVELAPHADAGAVYAAIGRLGGVPQQAAGATARGVPLVDVLRTILQAVAVVDGLVCLYALVQACTLTVQERRRSIAVLRAAGAGPVAIRRLLTGATVVLIVPAAVLGVLLERLVLGPVLSGLAINYASLQLVPSAMQVAAVLAGLAAAGAFAVLWVARQAGREPVVAGLSA